jgi:MFS family permease
VFVGGLALFGIASLVGGLAQDQATLVAARAGQGLGGAVMAPTWGSSG